MIFEVVGNVLVVELLGELDHHTAVSIRKSVDEIMEKYKAKNIVFDFEKVSYMDSSGIGLILGYYRRQQENDGQIAIVSCSKFVRIILNMAGIFSLVSYYDTKQEAIEMFRRKEVS